MTDVCKHELLLGTCVDCKPRAVDEADPVEASPAFPATFEGFCGGRFGKHGCGDRIDQGDEIRMQHGTAVHDGCED